MKVILLEDVAKVGRKYEEKDLAPGFARNFLIARGKARLPQDFTAEQLKTLRATVGASAALKQKEVEEVMATLADQKITIQAKASEEGHLFAGIKATDIAEEILKTLKVNISADLIHLDHALKNVGVHTVKVGDKNEIEVEIVAEA